MERRHQDGRQLISKSSYLLIFTKILWVNELLINDFTVRGSWVLTYKEGSHDSNIHIITVTHYIRAVFCENDMSLSKMNNFVMNFELIPSKDITRRMM